MLNSGIVVHYIRDYSKASIEKTKTTLNNFAAEETLNPNIPLGQALENFAENLPVGTVICIEMSKSIKKSAHVCLPMLSSHISLPVKSGEIIWFYKDTTASFDLSTTTAHPMLSINSYWLSRKVGSRTSEDLSFCFTPRDINISNNSQNIKDKLDGLESKKTDDKKRNKLLKKEEDKKIKLPEYAMPETFITKYPFLKDKEVSNVYNDSKSSFDFYPTAVPRWNSKPFELSLQGSNNSLVNLTKSFTQEKEYQTSGAIDLVAGRHMLETYKEYEEDDFYIIKGKIIQNEKDKEKRKVDELSINKSSSYLKIKNINEDIETLKNQKIYFGEEFKKEGISLEGENSFENDASRIYITEFDNLDGNTYYNSTNITQHNLLDTTGGETEISFTTKDYLVDAKKVSGKNFSSKSIQNSKSILPSVLIKSNDIRIIARKKVSDGEKTLEEGSIRLIKESSDFYNSSCIMLEKSGNVFIDGNIIHLGNFKKEVERLKIDTENVDDVKKMSGNGYGLLIGYDQKFSEPLVLGNTLEAILKEMINVNIKLIDEIKKLSDDLAKHTHLGIPITGISGPPQVPVPYTTFSSKEHADITGRYKELQNNLIDMLSKFAKTS